MRIFYQLGLFLVGVVVVIIEASLFQYWLIPLFLIGVYFFKPETKIWFGFVFGLSHDFLRGGFLGSFTILILLISFILKSINERRSSI